MKVASQARTCNDAESYVLFGDRVVDFCTPLHVEVLTEP